MRRSYYTLYTPALHAFYKFSRRGSIRRTVVNAGYKMTVYVCFERKFKRLFPLLLKYIKHNSSRSYAII